MVLTERAVSQFFLTILTIDGMHSTSRTRHNPLGILSDFIDKDSGNPLIVVIRSAEHAEALDNEMVKLSNQDYSAAILEPSSHDNYISAKIESVNDIYDVMVKIKNDDNIYNNILRTKDEADKLEKDQMIFHALRSRCQALVECTEICPEEKPKPKDSCSESKDSCSESLEKCTEEDSCEEEKKPEKYCPKSCKAIFDELLNCPPPGNDRNKKRHKNQSTRALGPPTGKTMPPNWKHGFQK